MRSWKVNDRLARMPQSGSSSRTARLENRPLPSTVNKNRSNDPQAILRSLTLAAAEATLLITFKVRNWRVGVGRPSRVVHTVSRPS